MADERITRVDTEVGAPVFQQKTTALDPKTLIQPTTKPAGFDDPIIATDKLTGFEDPLVADQK